MQLTHPFDIPERSITIFTSFTAPCEEKTCRRSLSLTCRRTNTHGFWLCYRPKRSGGRLGLIICSFSLTSVINLNTTPFNLKTKGYIWVRSTEPIPTSHLVVNSPNKNPIGNNRAQAGRVVGQAVLVVFWRRRVRGGGAADALRWTAVMWTWMKENDNAQWSNTWAGEKQNTHHLGADLVNVGLNSPPRWQNTFWCTWISPVTTWYK